MQCKAELLPGPLEIPLQNGNVAKRQIIQRMKLKYNLKIYAVLRSTKYKEGKPSFW